MKQCYITVNDKSLRKRGKLSDKFADLHSTEVDLHQVMEECRRRFIALITEIRSNEVKSSILRISSVSERF